MNSIRKIITIGILIIGVHFTFSILINMNIYYHKGHNFENIDGRSESILRRAGHWEIGEIEIDDTDPTKNWSTTEALYDWCSGSGIINNPYIIENVSINRQYSGHCIDIRYSNAFFIIRNCTVYNSGHNYNGIYLNYVDNAQILNNNCTFNGDCGIFLQGGGSSNTISDNIVVDNLRAGIHLGAFYENCVITGNTLSNNGQDGIALRQDCDNNTIKDNVIYNSGYSGILLQRSEYNIVKENRVYNSWRGITVYIDSNFNSIQNNKISDWEEYGIYLYLSNNNTISENTLIGNGTCIEENNCEGNVFENNYCGKGDEETIPGYNLFLLLVILSCTLVFSIRKRKRSYTTN